MAGASRTLSRCCRLAGAWLLVGIVVLGAVATAAEAEVRFGRNVRVGGHDFSNQTFNRKRRAEIRLYDRQPRRPGCVWRADGRGGTVKLCNLRRIRR